MDPDAGWSSGSSVASYATGRGFDSHPRYMTPDSQKPSQTLRRCAWCKEWGRPAAGEPCGKCGEVYIPVPNVGPPQSLIPESCAKPVDG